MAKGDDALRRKKNKPNRKKQRANDSATVSNRIAAIIPAKKRRQTGKRWNCQQNDLVAKFHDHPLEHEELMQPEFQGVVATGEHQITPGEDVVHHFSAQIVDDDPVEEWDENSPQSQWSMPISSGRDSSGNKRETSSSSTDAILHLMNMLMKKLENQKPYRQVVTYRTGLFGDVMKLMSSMEYFKDPAVRHIYLWMVDHIKSDLANAEILLALPNDEQKVEFVQREYRKGTGKLSMSQWSMPISSGRDSSGNKRETSSSSTDAILHLMNMLMKKLENKKPYRQVVTYRTGLFEDVMKLMSNMEYFKDPAVRHIYRWMVYHIKSDLANAEILLALPNDEQRVEFVQREYRRALGSSP